MSGKRCPVLIANLLQKSKPLGIPGCILLDENRAHDVELIKKVKPLERTHQKH
jgi:monomeric isocitrate dehydrogenase